MPGEPRDYKSIGGIIDETGCTSEELNQELAAVLSEMNAKEPRAGVAPKPWGLQPTEKTIRIADDFSRCGGARFRSLGKFSGEEFRDDHLIPALLKYKKVTLDFDGSYGYPPSWLSEVFYSLARRLPFIDRDYFNANIVLKSKEYPELPERILKLIDEAQHE